MYLSDLLAALRRHWLVALLAIAFWGVVGVAMVTLSAERYRSTATVAVLGDPEEGLAQVATYQIPIMVKSIGSRRFHEQVRPEVPAEHRDADVAITASAPVGTGLIDVSVSGADPEAVAAWANAAKDVLASTDDPSGLTISVIEDAFVPGSPYSPKVMPIAVGTAGLALVSAVVAAVVVARVGRALDAAEDIQRRSGVTVLGQVPPLRELRHLPSGQGVAEALRHSADVVEVFRSITTNIELAVVDRPEPAIAVLSAAPGEGKSTITAGIALTTAMAGVHVLAVDASLRRPSLHVQLGQQFGGGMSRATEATVADAVQRTEVPNLSLLPAGVPDRHPADILTTALPATLAHASEHHLRVLIDCPPMDGAAETAMVAAMARNVVVVVDPRRTDVADLDALLSRLRAGGVDVIGVVLNRVGRGRRRTRTSYSQVLPARAPARSTPSRRTARV